MLRFIKKLFKKEPSSPPEPVQQLPGEEKFIYCLVGNIKDSTLHFSRGTKVYCFPPLWGDGYQQIKVIGRHRKTGRLSTMVISSYLIENWRIKTVFNPKVISIMAENGGWTDSEQDKERLQVLLNSL